MTNNTNTDKDNTSQHKNIQDNWNKSRQNKEKLLSFYNDTIKPTLLDFYNITQEGFIINTDQEALTHEPYITLKGNLVIQYYRWDTDTNPTYSIHLVNGINTLTAKTIGVSNNIDIRMVKLLVRYWDKIKAYLDTTIYNTVLEYESLSSKIH